jgi:hypothetical protein
LIPTIKGTEHLIPTIKGTEHLIPIKGTEHLIPTIKGTEHLIPDQGDRALDSRAKPLIAPAERRFGVPQRERPQFGPRRVGFSPRLRLMD